MKSLFLYFSLILLNVSVSLSQSVSRQVIGSAGNFASSSGTAVSWTIGEPVIETFTSDDYLILQGFHGCGYAIPEYTISLSSDPAEGGIVSGGGTYEEGVETTISATPNEDYTFKSWTENGTVVSTNSDSTFTVIEDLSLTANFILESVGLRDGWKSFRVDIYPNPSENRLIIDFDEPQKESFTLQLITTSGKQMLIRELPAGTKQKTIALSGLKSGPYIVKIFNSTKKKTFTLIKE